jgi:iron complex transport system ATP-binding protein
MSVRLDLRGVSFSYGEQAVLDGLDLGLRPGEMAALLGANGSGKTTLLGLATGVLRPKLGEVLLDGANLHRISRRAVARKVSVLAQEIGVPTGWAVREVVSLGRTPHITLLGEPGPADAEAIRAALRITAVEDIADRSMDSLSGGQQQRALLAMALAQGPQLLVLDEPTAHLDLRYRAELLDGVRELHELLGITVLAAMHDPSLAALYFPRIMLLSRGRVLADGPPEEVLTEELLEEVYGAPVRVTHDPVLGAPVVTVLPRHARARRNAAIK